jgi:hypothetical protein
MITVHHGSSHSFPLHPEHQEAIGKLKDGESTTFTDETKSKVTAHREGDTVHLSHRGSSTKTPVAMSHFTEEVEQVDEAKRGRPRKDGSKPAGDDDHQEADKNIHTQLHKVISANKPVTFNNGKTHTITSAHAHKALSMLQNAKASDRLAIQHSLSHSHDRFHETLKTGKAIVDAPRPKVSLAKSVKEDAQVDEARGEVAVSDRRERIAVQATNPKTGRPAVRWAALPKRSVKVSEALSKENMAQDSVDKIKKDPLASKEKIDLPATTGNKPIGGEGQAYSGKSTMAEEVSLNNLYNNLSENNRVKFNEKMLTAEGKAELLKFAQEQGY